MATERPAAIGRAITTFDAAGIAALLYVVLISTFAGFALWAWLLRHPPMSAVAPFARLVPVVGIAAACAALGEQPSAVESSPARRSCSRGCASPGFRRPAVARHRGVRRRGQRRPWKRTGHRQERVPGRHRA
jgi:EamA-like transporter family